MKSIGVPDSLFRRMPFPTLVRHFAKRSLSSDEEEAVEPNSLGIGAVLAILASPGAFASIFLLDKYSTLLQWLRGLQIDPLRTSVADEYFFIVLSMTIIGLVLVFRWNRLFPDRRDFANLAALPIPIPWIFLANLAALTGLAVLFGLDVNAVSAFLFPGIVTLKDASLFWQVALAHWSAIFLASLFSFSAIFALVGILMLVLPRKVFRQVSVFVRMLLVVALLIGFFSNLLLQLFSGHLPKQANAYMRYLPSIWFLGIYQRNIGVATPAALDAAAHAVYAVLLAISSALLAYTLCYRRYFLRLPEMPEISGISKKPVFHLGVLFRPFWRTPLEWAASGFFWKALTRSERHLMFVGAYLGVGAVLVAQSAMDVSMTKAPPHFPHSTLLGVPLAAAFFLGTALRFAFDLPASVQCNWIFRLSVVSADPPLRSFARRLLSIGIFPLISIVWTVFMSRYGWPLALMSSSITLAWTFLLVETLLPPHFQKIPFTYNVASDTRRFVTRILCSVLGVIIAVPVLSQFEAWSLQSFWRWTTVLLLTFAALLALQRFRRGDLPETNLVTFDEAAPDAFEILRLV